MEENSRNSQGRFVSGHKGAKPKGAINRSTREYLVRLQKINDLLESNLMGNIPDLSKNYQAKLWMELQKFIHLKMSKFTEPDPEKEKISKIIFELVGADGKTINDKPAPDAKPSAGVPGPPPPAQVPPAANAPILYGAIDTGKVRSSSCFRRARSL